MAQPYGFPRESLGALKEITLDLRTVEDGLIGYVSKVDPSPALELIGPFPEDVELGDRNAWDDLPRIAPSSRQFSGGIITFMFAEPIPQGTYRAVVHASRIEMKTKDGTRTGAPTLTMPDSDEAWDGWFLTVLDEPHETTGAPDIELPIEGDPITLSEVNQLFGSGASTPSNVTVYLDNKKLPIGSSELSGEVLEIRGADLSKISIEFQSLLPRTVESLYEKYVTKNYVVESTEGLDIVRYTSVGPSDNYYSAVYHGTDTLGKLVTNDESRLLFAVPFTQKETTPSATSKLTLDEIGNETDEAGNTYKLYKYYKKPQVSPLDEEGEVDTDWESDSIYFVVDVDTSVDPSHTPKEDPTILQEIVDGPAVYRGATAFLTDTTKVGILDLPLNCRVYIKLDNEVVWWGQTRALPALLTPEHFSSFGGPTPNTPQERADVIKAILLASAQALRLWKCKLPRANDVILAPASMQEFILVWLLVNSSGGLYQTGHTGSVSIRIGDNYYQGTSDNSLRDRLSALANLLAACNPDVPLFAEDSMYATNAYVASQAYPSLYPAPDPFERTLPYAPLVESGVHRGRPRLGGPRRPQDRHDPSQHSRPRY